MADIIELGKRVKAKFPGQYDSLSDADVGRRVKEKYPEDYAAFTDVDTSTPESAPKRFARGVGDAVLSQAKGALAPAGLGGDLLPVDSEGNVKMPYSDGDRLHRVLASVHPGLPALYDAIAHGDRARALGQTAANLPGLIQGLFGGGKAALAEGAATVPEESSALMRSLPTSQRNPLAGVGNPLKALNEVMPQSVQNLLLRGHPALRLTRQVLRAGQDVSGAEEAAASNNNPLRDWVKAQDPVQPSNRPYYENPYNVADTPTPPVANDPYVAGRARPNVDPMEELRRGIPTSELVQRSRGYTAPEEALDDRADMGPVDTSGQFSPSAYRPPPVPQPEPPPRDPYTKPYVNPAPIRLQDVVDRLGIGRAGRGSMEYEGAQPTGKVKPEPPVANSPYYQAPPVKVTKPPADFTGATDSWDAGYRPAPPEEPIRQYGHRTPSGNTSASMEYEGQAPAAAKQSATPAPAKAPVVTSPPPVKPGEAGPSLTRPEGITDADWQGMQNRIANRSARAKEAVSYFNAKGITADQIREMAEKSPATGQNQQHGGTLAEHAKSFGNKRPFSASIVTEILRQMGLGGQ